MVTQWRHQVESPGDRADQPPEDHATPPRGAGAATQPGQTIMTIARHASSRHHRGARPDGRRGRPPAHGAQPALESTCRSDPAHRASARPCSADPARHHGDSPQLDPGHAAVATMTRRMTRLANHDHDLEVPRLDRGDEVGEIAARCRCSSRWRSTSRRRTRSRARYRTFRTCCCRPPTHKEFAQSAHQRTGAAVRRRHGLFYSFDEARHRLDLLGSYGLRLSHRSADHYMPGEGLVGQCALERRPIMRHRRTGRLPAASIRAAATRCRRTSRSCRCCIATP